MVINELGVSGLLGLYIVFSSSRKKLPEFGHGLGGNGVFTAD